MGFHNLSNQVQHWDSLTWRTAWSASNVTLQLCKPVAERWDHQWQHVAKWGCSVLQQCCHMACQDGHAVKKILLCCRSRASWRYHPLQSPAGDLQQGGQQHLAAAGQRRSVQLRHHGCNPHHAFWHTHRAPEDMLHQSAPGEPIGCAESGAEVCMHTSKPESKGGTGKGMMVPIHGSL